MKSDNTLTIPLWLVVTAAAGLLALILIPVGYRFHEKRKLEANALWVEDGTRLTAVVYNQLKTYCWSQTNYPALTAEELHQRGIFDDKVMAFLKSTNVQFHPFSSATPDTDVVFSVNLVPELKINNRVVVHNVFLEEFTKADILDTNDPGESLDLGTYR